MKEDYQLLSLNCKLVNTDCCAVGVARTALASNGRRHSILSAQDYWMLGKNGIEMGDRRYVDLIFLSKCSTYEGEEEEKQLKLRVT